MAKRFLALSLVCASVCGSVWAEEDGEKKCHKAGEAYNIENMNLPSCELGAKSNLDKFKGPEKGNEFKNGGAAGSNSNSNGTFGNGSSVFSPQGNRSPASAGGGAGTNPQGGTTNPTAQTGQVNVGSPTPNSGPSGGTGGSDYNQSYQNNDGDARWIK